MKKIDQLKGKELALRARALASLHLLEFSNQARIDKFATTLLEYMQRKNLNSLNQAYEMLFGMNIDDHLAKQLSNG